MVKNDPLEQAKITETGEPAVKAAARQEREEEFAHAVLTFEEFAPESPFPAMKREDLYTRALNLGFHDAAHRNDRELAIILETDRLQKKATQKAAHIPEGGSYVGEAPSAPEVDDGPPPPAVPVIALPIRIPGLSPLSRDNCYRAMETKLVGMGGSTWIHAGTVLDVRHYGVIDFERLANQVKLAAVDPISDEEIADLEAQRDEGEEEEGEEEDEAGAPAPAGAKPGKRKGKRKGRR